MIKILILLALLALFAVSYTTAAPQYVLTYGYPYHYGYYVCGDFYEKDAKLLTHSSTATGTASQDLSLQVYKRKLEPHLVT
ncbi:hypothetical protein MTO96_040617 [Rhipicephalus appendiculatus]